MQYLIGNIVLTDLRLKKEALDKLDLPIEVFYGHLGRLELHIPWRNLKSQPVTVIVEDLLLLAGPRVETTFDAELEEEREQKTKQERLEAAELFAASVENQLSEDIHHESFTTQLVTKIVDNLQVTVKNIHIRFEDSTSNPNRPFHVGITLKNLKAVSCDDDWNETFIVNPQDAVNKLIKLDLLSVYWNTHELKPMKDLSFEEFVSTCRESIDDIQSHAYIIEPVSGTGRATLNKYFRDGVPKALLNILFDSFGINVNYHQYFDILCALASVSSAQRALPYRKFRPRNGKLEAPELWRYAIQSNMSTIHEKNQRRAWSFIMKRRRLRKEYINLFSNKIILGELTGEDSATLAKLERQIDFDDLLQYRNMAKAFAKKTIANSPRGRISRFWDWLGFKSAASSELVKETDIQELYETIDYDAGSGDPSKSVPGTTQMLKVNFELARGSISLSQEPHEKVPLVALSFANLLSTIVKRPQTIAVDLALTHLQLTEHLMEESKFHDILQIKPSLPTSPTSKKPLLYFSYDSLATNPDASAQIYLNMRPLMLVVNLQVVDRLVAFLLNQNTRPLLEAVKAEAQRAFEAIQEQTRANLQLALEEHRGTELGIKISAPIILFPEDPTDLGKSIFIVDLGKLKAESELVSAEEKEKITSLKRDLTDEERETFHDLLYDRIRLHLLQVGIYMFDKAVDWSEIVSQDLSSQEHSREHKLINEIDLEVLVENSIIPQATNIAKTKVSINLPEIIFFLSDRKISRLLALVDTLPKSSSSSSSFETTPTIDDTKTDKVKRIIAPKPKTSPPNNNGDDEFFDALDDIKTRPSETIKSPEASKQIIPNEEVDQLTLTLNAVIERIVIFMSKQSESDVTEELRLSLMVYKLSVMLQMHQTLILLESTLGGIGFREHLSSFEGSLLIDASATLSSSDLLQSRVALVKPNNADFATIYKSVERHISLDIASIKINLDPACIFKCAEFALKDVLPIFQSKALSSSLSSSSSKVSDTTGSGAGSLITTAQPGTRIILGFAGLQVCLLDSGMTSSCLNSGSLKLEVDLMGKCLSLRGDITDMNITCCLDKEIVLVYFEGNTVASFSFETNCQRLGIIGESNMAKVSCGSLHLSYNADAFAQIVSSIFQLLRIVELLPQEAPSDQQLMQKKNSQENMAPTYLDVFLAAPKIFFPSNKGPHTLSISLGTLKIVNEIQRVAEEFNNNGFDQFFDLSLSEVNIGILNDDNNTTRTLMDDATIPLKLRLTHQAFERQFADVEVDGDIPVISFSLDEGDFKHLMQIIQDTTSSIGKIVDATSSHRSGSKATAVGEDDKAVTVSEKNHFLFDCQLLFRGVLLCLKDGADASQVSLSIDGIQVGASSHTQRGFSTEVCIESIRISDVAHQDLKYSDLLAVGLAAENLNQPLIDSRRQFFFRMEQGLDKKSSIKLYLESPRIFVLFDTIFYMQKFFLANLPAAPETPSRTTTDPLPQGTISEEISMLLSVDVIDAVLIVPDDRTIEASDAISLRIGRLYLKKIKDLKLALEELSCNIYNMAAPDKTRIAVIDRFSTQFHLSTIDDRSNFDVTIVPLAITFSFQDLQLILSLLNTMNDARARHAFERTTIETSISDSSASTLALSVSPKSPQLAEKAFLEESGDLKLEYIRVIIIDDSSGANIPLLQMNLDSIECLVENWSSNLKISTKGILAINSFNPSVSFWEPILEKWPFEVKLGKLADEPNCNSTFLVSSTQGVEIAIVHDSVERMLAMLSKLGREKRHPLAEREVSDPFKFINLLDLTLSVTAFSSASTEKGSRIRLDPGKNEKLAIEDIKSVRSELLSRSYTMNVQLDGDYEQVSDIHLDKDGIIPVRVAALTAKPTREFYIHSYLENSVRTSCFRERFLLYNSTAFAIIVTFNGGETGTSKKLEPKEKICIPHDYESAIISMTILNSELNLMPIENFIDCNHFSHIANGVFTARAAIEEQFSFHIQSSIDRPLASRELLDIVFSAPIYLENLLPFDDVQLQVSQGNLKKVYELGESQELGIHHINPESPFTLALSIPSIGMFSTNECALSEKKVCSDPLTLQNEKGLELKISLNQGYKVDGALHLSISAFYLLVNQTGYNLQVLSEANNKIKKNDQVFAHTKPDVSRPMLVFSHPNVKSAKNRVRLRVGDSNWSDLISFEAVGADFSVDMKSMLTSKWYNIGGNVSLGQGKFGMTKIIFISQRYYVVNDTTRKIIVTDGISEYKILPKTQSAVNFDPSNISSIQLKVEDAREWSAPFDIVNTGHVYVRDDELESLFRVGRTIKSPSFFISISETDSWPYLIENHTSSAVYYFQKEVGIQRECKPSAMERFSWDMPSMKEKELVLSFGDEDEYTLAAFEIGRKARFRVKTNDDGVKTILLQVKARGPAVVIGIREKSRRSTLPDPADIEAPVEQQTYVEIFDSVFLIKLPYLAVSLVDASLKEVVLVYLRDIELRYAMTAQFVSYGLTIKWLQIDNQAFDWDHPMMLYPSVLSKSQKELKEHPFLSFGAIQARDRSYGVTYYKYLGLLIQEMSVEVGEELLRNLLAFSSFSVLVADPKSILTEQQCVVPTFMVERDSSEILFFEFFQVHPLKISLTFSTTEDTRSKENTSKLASLNPMVTILDVLIMTFGNISDAPLKFNALVLENILSRQATLLEIVLDHYKSEALSQVHLVLGSADFLGNPVGLVSTLGSGVTDLFYEPYQGLVSDRPQDIGIGLARGGVSLVKKTVSGLTGTLSKFTGSLAKGLSAVTFDKSWQQKRRVDRAKNKPRHALSGVSTGMRQLLMGFSSGLSGVVDKPLEGAREGGVGGFFKGVGVGLVGAVTKPVVGLMDLTTSLTEGIKSSADDTQHTVTQIRFPRVIPFDRKVRPYDLRESFGQSILIGVIGFSKIGEEFYIDHIVVPGEDCLVILTDSRLLKVSVSRLRIIWEMLLNSIVNVKTTEEMLEIHYASENGMRARYVPLLDQASQQWFSKSIRRQIEQI